MGYNKLIIYGNVLESFEYEKEHLLLGTKRKSQNDYGVKSDRNVGDTMLESEVARLEATKEKRKDNARRSSMAFRRIVICNLSGHENPLLLTFTYRENKTKISDAYRDFTNAIKACRYKFGTAFRYICVPEFQKRGAVHFHALFWGVQKELLGLSRQYPNNSIDCFYWEHGFTFCKQTDGNKKIASYLSKYMAKAFLDSRLFSKKAYVASKNINRPYVVGGLNNFAFGYLRSDCLGVDNFPVISRQYMTQYLGNCDYQLFNLK